MKLICIYLTVLATYFEISQSYYFGNPVGGSVTISGQASLGTMSERIINGPQGTRLALDHGRAAVLSGLQLPQQALSFLLQSARLGVARTREPHGQLISRAPFLAATRRQAQGQISHLRRVFTDRRNSLASSLSRNENLRSQISDGSRISTGGTLPSIGLEAAPLAESVQAATRRQAEEIISRNSRVSTHRSSSHASSLSRNENLRSHISEGSRISREGTLSSIGLEAAPRAESVQIPTRGRSLLGERLFNNGQSTAQIPEGSQISTDPTLPLNGLEAAPLAESIQAANRRQAEGQISRNTRISTHQSSSQASSLSTSKQSRAQISEDSRISTGETLPSIGLEAAPLAESVQTATKSQISRNSRISTHHSSSQASSLSKSEQSRAQISEGSRISTEGTLPSIGLEAAPLAESVQVPTRGRSLLGGHLSNDGQSTAQNLEGSQVSTGETLPSIGLETAPLAESVQAANGRQAEGQISRNTHISTHQSSSQASSLSTSEQSRAQISEGSQVSTGETLPSIGLEAAPLAESVQAANGRQAEERVSRNSRISTHQSSSQASSLSTSEQSRAQISEGSQVSTGETLPSIGLETAPLAESVQAANERQAERQISLDNRISTGGRNLQGESLSIGEQSRRQISESSRVSTESTFSSTAAAHHAESSQIAAEESAVGQVSQGATHSTEGALSAAGLETAREAETVQIARRRQRQFSQGTVTSTVGHSIVTQPRGHGTFISTGGKLLFGVRPSRLVIRPRPRHF